MTTDVVPSGPAKRPLFGQPFAWLVLAIVLAMVPFAGWLSQTGWPWTRIHPAVNAMLNGSAAVFLVAGGLAIRKRKITVHGGDQRRPNVSMADCIELYGRLIDAPAEAINCIFSSSSSGAVAQLHSWRHALRAPAMLVWTKCK